MRPAQEKTIAALHGAVKIALDSEGSNQLVLVVAVPYQVLGDQWCEVMGMYNLSPIKCYVSRKNWHQELDKRISNLNLSDQTMILPIVVVNATLRTSHFQRLLNKVRAEECMMFVGDECHHHDNEKLLKSLPRAKFRLGLSATPWAVNDYKNSQAKLTRYYGDIVSQYSIDDALSDGVLTPYNYFLHHVELTPDESDEYKVLSGKIAKLTAMREGGAKINEERLTSMQMSRARLIGSAQNKFECFSLLIDKDHEKSYTLFYAGDGSVEQYLDDGTKLDDSELLVRDVDRLANILHKNNWRTSRITYKESPNQRNQILENFKLKVIDGVVAIRVLDEGFDIPACRKAYLLASSRNERQFIQRRGRILRKFKGKQHSVIHDFIVTGYSGENADCFTTLARKELVRAAEFSRVAKNKDEVDREAESIASAVGLDFQEISDQWEADREL